MSLYYSKISDYQVEDGVLNVYLPVSPDTLDLIQHLYDLRKPRNEYFDTTNNGELVAVEWFFPAGEIVLKKLQRTKKWNMVFSEVGNVPNTPLNS